VESGIEDAGWDQEAEGHCYYQVDVGGGGWGTPAGEGVDLVEGEGEGGCEGFDGDFFLWC
jgi:hypothetical protein